MSKYYNKNAASDGTGGLGSPWNNGASISVVSGDTLFIMRGTESNTVRVNLDGIVGLTVRPYASDFDGSDDTSLPMPVLTGYRVSTDTAEWTKPDAINEPGLFVKTITKAGAILGYGLLGTVTKPAWQERSDYLGTAAGSAGYAALDTDGDWDSSNTNLYVYTTDGTNPVTKLGNIYYATVEDVPFGVENVTLEVKNIDIQGIVFRNCISGIYVRANFTGRTLENIKAKHCRFEHCYDPMVVVGFTTSVVVDINMTYNVYLETGGKSVYGITQHENFQFHHNYVDRVGGAIGIGLAYASLRGANALKPALIHDNVLKNINRTLKTWPGESMGLYVEHTSKNVHAYRNKVSGVPYSVGLMSNSGFEDGNIWFWSNIVDEVQTGSYSNDAQNQGAGGVHYWNNICKNTKIGLKTWSNIATTRVVSAANNIYIANLDPASVGISKPSAYPDLLVESNNCAFGYNLPFENLTADATDITSDPELDGDYAISATSPAKGAGTTPPSFVTDFQGEAFGASVPMGANVSKPNIIAVNDRSELLLTNLPMTAS